MRRPVRYRPNSDQATPATNQANDAAQTAKMSRSERCGSTGGSRATADPAEAQLELELHHVPLLMKGPWGAVGPPRALYSCFFVPTLERAWTRSGTSRASYTPRITRYRTPGKSGLRPGRTSTVWCSWMFDCSPGIDAVTSYPVFSRTRQQTRLPEFGLRGLTVKTRRT